MPSARLTSKGQITIPIDVRNALGVSFGDRLNFVEIEKGRFLIVPATCSVRELKGMIPRPKRPVRVQDMNGVAAIRNLKVWKK